MNEQQSYLAKCALFFLRKLYPNENCEPLVGDLLEQLSEGQSTGWLWRQVLVALGVTAFSRLRLILPEISVFAAAVTAICVFPWGLILPVGLMNKQSGTEWIPTVLAVDILSVLVISPLFATLLILRNAFTWAQALRTSGSLWRCC